MSVPTPTSNTRPFDEVHHASAETAHHEQLHPPALDVVKARGTLPPPANDGRLSVRIIHVRGNTDAGHSRPIAQQRLDDARRHVPLDDVIVDECGVACPQRGRHLVHHLHGHEIGHVLGVDHEARAGQVADPLLATAACRLLEDLHTMGGGRRCIGRLRVSRHADGQQQSQLRREMSSVSFHARARVTPPLAPSPA